MQLLRQSWRFNSDNWEERMWTYPLSMRQCREQCGLPSVRRRRAGRREEAAMGALAPQRRKEASITSATCPCARPRQAPK